VLKIYVCKLLVKTWKIMQTKNKICKAKRKEFRKFKYTINFLWFVCTAYLAVESSKCKIFWDCVSSISYPGCSSKTPHCIIFCGLIVSTKFFVIISWNEKIYVRRFFQVVCLFLQIVFSFLSTKWKRRLYVNDPLFVRDFIQKQIFSTRFF
jgi:hypothetical protein